MHKRGKRIKMFKSIFKVIDGVLKMVWLIYAYLIIKFFNLINSRVYIWNINAYFILSFKY